MLQAADNVAEGLALHLVPHFTWKSVLGTENLLKISRNAKPFWQPLRFVNLPALPKRRDPSWRA